MAQNTPDFDAVISVKTGKTGEDGRPQYRSTRLGVAFKDSRSSKEHITVVSDLLLHPIHLWERTPNTEEEYATKGETATEKEIDLDKPAF